jgi:glutaredoxin-like protein NrdH
MGGPSEGHCKNSHRLSFAKGLAFQKRDIAQDPGALADLKNLGYMTTPVIVIDGAVIVGFDSAKIDKHAVDSNTLGV